MFQSHRASQCKENNEDFHLTQIAQEWKTVDDEKKAMYNFIAHRATEEKLGKKERATHIPEFIEEFNGMSAEEKEEFQTTVAKKGKGKSKGKSKSASPDAPRGLNSMNFFILTKKAEGVEKPRNLWSTLTPDEKKHWKELADAENTKNGITRQKK